ncbi:MAG: TetR/AcrR family transcriptional regulator [Verrucomicrobia bacterium]|nr:TetR/AcrR family transcriptional regulator [Verrucomicrobiota bacterium]
MLKVGLASEAALHKKALASFTIRMPRVIKHPDQRRSEILNQALTLFLSRGYDHVSLNDIIANAGISKGVFYHYFLSKEALLAALADQFAHQALADLEHVLNDPALNPLQRLNAFLAKGTRIKTELAPAAWAVFGALFRPENLGLYQRVVTASEQLFRPILTDIITQGVKEHLFETADPEGVADLLQQLASTTYSFVTRIIGAETEQEKQDALKAFHRRLRLNGVAIDRLLGLDDGSLYVPSLAVVKKLMAKLMA